VGARLLAHWCRLLVRCVPVSLGISLPTLLILSNGNSQGWTRARSSDDCSRCRKLFSAATAVYGVSSAAVIAEIGLPGRQ